MHPSPPKKTVLITGGARRVGRYLTTYLVKKGYHVLLHYNTASDDAQTLFQHPDFKGAITPIQADFSSQKSITSFLETITSFPKIDCCINNASTFRRNTLPSFSFNTFIEDIQINTLVPILLTHAIMRHNPNGHVIQCSDAKLALQFSQYYSYAVSKDLLEYYSHMSSKHFPSTFRINTLRFGHILPNVNDTDKNHSPTGKELSALKNIAETIVTLENTPSLNQQVLYFGEP